MSGLSQCVNGITNAYCAMKLIQVILSAGLSMFALSQIILTMVKVHGKFAITFVIAIQIFIMLSEGCRCFYEIWHNIVQYFCLFFNNMSFITIFYYVAFNIILNKIIVHLCYIVLTLIFIALCIARIFTVQPLSSKYHCSQKWYIIIDGLTLLISIILFIIFWSKHIEQNKMREYYKQKIVIKQRSQRSSNLSSYREESEENNVKNWKQKMNDPFVRMWVMILTNIICCIINDIETLIILVDFPSTCQLSQNKNIRAGANFAFQFFSQYLCDFVTLFILRSIRVNYVNSRQSNQQFVKNRTETFSNDSCLMRNKLQLVLHENMLSNTASKASSI